MVPTTTDARGGGHGGHSGGHAVSILGSSHHHSGPSIGFPFAVARVPFSSHHAISHGRFASRHSHAFGSEFFTLGTDGVWIETVEAPPTIVLTQETQEAAARSRAAAVRTPDAEREGIIVVRGTSKAYVTFPSAKAG